MDRVLRDGCPAPTCHRCVWTMEPMASIASRPPILVLPLYRSARARCCHPDGGNGSVRHWQICHCSYMKASCIRRQSSKMHHQPYDHRASQRASPPRFKQLPLSSASPSSFLVASSRHEHHHPHHHHHGTMAATTTTATPDQPVHHHLSDPASSQSCQQRCLLKAQPTQQLPSTRKKFFKKHL